MDFSDLDLLPQKYEKTIHYSIFE